MPVKVGEQWGLIDKFGHFILEPEYEKILGFNDEELAPIKIDNKWCLINKKGKVIFKTNFDHIGPFYDGLAVFSENNKRGYINKNGVIVIPPQFPNKSRYPIDCTFSEGIASFNLNGKIGFINNSGKVIVNPTFDDASKFSEGLVKVGVKK